MALGQRAVRDQRRPQVDRALTAVNGVERVVGEREGATGKLQERLVAAAAVHPSQHRPRLGASGERRQIPLESLDGRGVAGSLELPEAGVQNAAGAVTIGVVRLLRAAAAADLKDALPGAALA